MSKKNRGQDIGVRTLPRARTENIVVQEYGSDVLVYDLATDKAHHLNSTVTAVWRKCDGKTLFEEMAQSLESSLKTKIDPDFVWMALDELDKAGLLGEKIAADTGPVLSRRKVLVRYAPLAAALPVVMSLVAPPAAFAQSCVAMGDPCMVNLPPDCCPGLFCEGGSCI
ncbi:MAG: PqqD family protein [Acidobacteriota bacterium]|nr:PqqD family protein [Acidobacteriota bacterium]MDH3528088.1 PqqD family protein [Acidobacteriota bacterium]